MKKIITLLFIISFVGLFAQSNHTISIDGTNDFTTATERFETTSGATLYGYVTWDATNIYVGFSGNSPAGSVTDGGRVYHIYIDSDAFGSTGTTDGETWRWDPTLPFTANYHYAFKTSDNSEFKRTFNGSWGNATINTSNWKGSGYWEVAINRADIGSPSHIKLVAYVEEDWDGGSICGGLPSDAFTNTTTSGSITFDHYLGYSLTSGLTPTDANAHDAVLVKGDYGNDYSFGYAGSRATFRVNDDASLDVTGDFTLEAWIYRSGSTSQFFIERPGRFLLFLTGSNGTVGFNLDPGLGDLTTPALTDLTWNHVAVVRSGSTTTIYLNGVGGANDDIPLSAADNIAVNIGAAENWGSGAATHKIDEVKFSNKALYKSNFIPSTTSPLGSDENTIFYFQFENNSEVPPLDDGPNSLSTTNGPTAGSTAGSMGAGNYLVPPSGLPLPVELTSFTALPQGEFVNLTWETATEVNNYGFEIERTITNSKLQIPNWENVGFVEGHGNSNSVKQYSFTDNTVIAGQAYSYRLKQIDFDGQFEYSSIVNVEAGIPTEFNLEQNYPNPFNPATSISFSLPKAAQVNLSVYNVLGEKVAKLVNTQMEAGKHTVNFNASNLSTGTYIYRIETPEFSTSKKMMLVK